MKEPRINVYQCQFGHMTVTVDVDNGVTPFMMSCKHAGCPATAQSSFYPRGPMPPHIPKPEWEWYRQTKKEAKKDDKRWPGSYHHWGKGGLALRPRTDAEPVYHKNEPAVPA